MENIEDATSFDVISLWITPKSITTPTPYDAFPSGNRKQGRAFLVFNNNLKEQDKKGK